MNAVHCDVPSRVHMTLYDMNGDLGRIDGGCGFSIEDPSFEFTMGHADQPGVYGEIQDEELQDAIARCIGKVGAAFGIDSSAEIEVDKIPASHSGFGSKTAVLLSVGQAFLKLHDQSADFRDLAGLLNRGGTSGLGINLIDKGGFILDGGHSTDEKQLFTPSSATGKVSPAPVLAQFKMPDWDILLVQPNYAKVFGDKEIDFFKEVCPVPSDDVDRLARTVMSQILPGVAEGRLDTFCEGVNRIQNNVWKSQEIKLYGPNMRKLMREIRELGALGVGMSSIGPTLYVMGGELETIKETLETSPEFDIEACSLTKPNNTGMTFQEA